MSAQTISKLLNKKRVKWFKSFLAYVIYAILLYFTFKFLLYSFFKLKSIKNFSAVEFFKLVITDFCEHIDLIGISIGLFIAFSMHNSTKNEFDDLRVIEENIHESLCELEITNSKIQKSTANLEDATRKIIETLPDILDESINIVEKFNISPLARKSSDRLLIMNYTSKFGVIHSFNKRFINQINTPTDSATLNARGFDEKHFQKLVAFKKKKRKIRYKDL